MCQDRGRCEGDDQDADRFNGCVSGQRADEGDDQDADRFNGCVSGQRADEGDDQDADRLNGCVSEQRADEGDDQDADRFNGCVSAQNMSFNTGYEGDDQDADRFNGCVSGQRSDEGESSGSCPRQYNTHHRVRWQATHLAIHLDICLYNIQIVCINCLMVDNTSIIGSAQ